MTAPDVAGDYRERDVQAVYRVLIELGQVLGAWRDKFVVVGGAVPWLLLPEANPSHIGTLDIDLALDPLSLEDEEYARLLETLEHSGYERNIEGLKPFQLRRWVRLDAGAPIAVLVDFLVPRGSKFESNDPTLVPGFRVISADGAGIAITHSTRQHLDGKMVDGRENSVDLLVATIPCISRDEGLRNRRARQEEGRVRYLLRHQKFPWRARSSLGRMHGAAQRQHRAHRIQPHCKEVPKRVRLRTDDRSTVPGRLFGAGGVDCGPSPDRRVHASEFTSGQVEQASQP